MAVFRPVMVLPTAIKVMETRRVVVWVRLGAMVGGWTPYGVGGERG